MSNPEFLDYFEPRILEYHALLTTNHIFVQRTAGIGILSKELALSHACSGPMLRGSLDRKKGDPEWDLRKLEPYIGYETYQFKAIIPPFDDDYYGVPYRAPRGAVLGDCWHRFYVRMIEVIESMKIVRQALGRYTSAQGSHRIEPPPNSFSKTRHSRRRAAMSISSSPRDGPTLTSWIHGLDIRPGGPRLSRWLPRAPSTARRGPSRTSSTDVRGQPSIGLPPSSAVPIHGAPALPR